MLLVPVASSRDVTHLIGEVAFLRVCCMSCLEQWLGGTVRASSVAGGGWPPHSPHAVGVPGFPLLPGSHRRWGALVPTEAHSEN